MNLNKWNTLLLKLLLCLLVSLQGCLVFPAAAGQEQASLYGIGSTSKVLTTAALLKLSGEGQIDLDLPLVHYIPEFVMEDSRYLQITPRMLLNHSSGLPGSTLTNAMLLGDSDTENHDNLLKRLQTQRLKADPGDFGVYCNDGFTLAEILVERVSGLTFTDYLEQKISIPLGLTHLKTPQSPGLLNNLAPIYDSQTKKELTPELANVIGSGGIYATAKDLCKVSQIFMKDPESAKEILPGELARSMEYSAYDLTYNPDGRDSTVSYGLGWDSVKTYPFENYGIKALVKGGDLSYYHANLTVLPELNISCAVLTSGGSSSACQLAVQEILLSYLEEIQEIDRRHSISQTSAASRQAAVPDLTDRPQWFSGAEMLQVTIKPDKAMTIRATGTGKEKLQHFTYGEDGAFRSEPGSYIGQNGMLTKGSGGTVGKSSVYFFTDPKGRTYLMSETYETHPGLGTTAYCLPVAQQLDTGEVPLETSGLWQQQQGKNFYLISEKYTSPLYFNRFLVKPLVLTEPAGYLTFEDNSLTAARITGANSAAFFQQIPGQAGRDLSDYRLKYQQGKLCLISGSGAYISEDHIPPLSADTKTVTIGADGLTEWFSINQAESYGFVTIQPPPQGSYFIYDTTKKEPACTASSYTTSSGESFLFPSKGKIAFAGTPGQTFTIRYPQP